jgi:hypothetical protein
MVEQAIRTGVDCMIDTSKYEGHTITGWSARNQGNGSLESCDGDYEDHTYPFIETDNGMGENPAIGYFVGGREAHSLEERRANMKLMADAPLLLAEVERLREVKRRCDRTFETPSIYNQNGVAVGFTITSCCKKDAQMSEHQAKKIQEYTMQDGRKVMRVPISNHQYINISQERDDRNWVNNQEWWLMIEANGYTWIWDGMTMEG